ncbi:hypothetical protein K431DRAFT_158575 [Polychaeton citri CBS 116435]|uniref:Cysteine protease n=1 Tax=Polychaeton citri CBS 116435 TaxID=1314669 RepID=A0A9P4Q2X6_9PEZI|nr:hypothetical protein K431DRAFT_158575 [Polychaeton citri CBS 116435]
MNNTDISRLGKRVVQYFWDPIPKNEDSAPIWCLGRTYESGYQPARPSNDPHTTGTSPSSQSDISKADSAVAPQDAEDKPKKSEEAASEAGFETISKSQADLSRSEEEALGWPPEFLDDLESRIWLTYRNNFPPIPKSQDPNAASVMSFSTRLRNLGNQGGFTSDTGWGCMIRSGQTLLANTLLLQRLGRDWRKAEEEGSERYKELLSLFADDPGAPFSIHKFVEHGAQACGKHPGEWFGPSATARCIQALTDAHASADLRVYVRPTDSDVYADEVLKTATAPADPSNSDTTFHPTLILLSTRLGIDRITPVYHATLKHTLQLPQCVGIAGGRPSSSHYFIGHQGSSFFYLDPHTTRSALPPLKSLAADDIATCHTRRVRKLSISEMDPSMLLGFLVRSKEEFEQWRKSVAEGPSGPGEEGKAFIHIHEEEPKYAVGNERPGAVDEVETWDETGDEGEGD